MRKTACLTLGSLIAIALVAPLVWAQPSLRGPVTDVFRAQVIKNEALQIWALEHNLADVLPNIESQATIEALSNQGFFILQDQGFHIGYIAYNIRADQSYRRTDLPGDFWPLGDADFRHALIHCYNQLEIVQILYGSTATPVRSLVPPAQSKYYNSAVPEHPYNPGDPFTSPPGEHSSCGILKAAGYTFVDEDSSDNVTDVDYWASPSGAMPLMKIWTPLEQDASRSYKHGQMFVDDLAAIGLKATDANGACGFAAEGEDFGWYLDKAYGEADFDAFMVFQSLGRIPSQLFSLLHSSQDSKSFPGRRNAVGVNDATIDARCETVQYSLDPNDLEAAARELQEMLYDPTLPNADNFALSYMVTHSMSIFNAFDEYLTGAIKSPGFGSDQMWTWLNTHWEPLHEYTEDGKTVIRYISVLEPDSFNPTVAHASGWFHIESTLDGLAAINPYNHHDIPWIACDWAITETDGGMDIDITLRDDVHWQDGYDFDASDVEFNWEFLRDWDSINGADAASHLIDVVVTDATQCTIQSDAASLSLFYDYMRLAAIVPPQIYDRPWADPLAVADYPPEEQSYGSDMAPGYAAGPWASQMSTNLFGTGPWIFQWYDLQEEAVERWANRNYWLTQADIATLLAYMFWEVGDCNQDGIVNVIDLVFVSFAFGSMVGDPEFDPDADFNIDGIVDMRDLRNAAFHLLWQKEYP